MRSRVVMARAETPIDGGLPIAGIELAQHHREFVTRVCPGTECVFARENHNGRDQHEYDKRSDRNDKQR
jgi:hypothetical protein